MSQPEFFIKFFVGVLTCVEEHKALEDRCWVLGVNFTFYFSPFPDIGDFIHEIGEYIGGCDLIVLEGFIDHAGVALVLLAAGCSKHSDIFYFGDGAFLLS